MIPISIQALFLYKPSLLQASKMSKMFFKGRKDPRQDYSTYGYNTDPNTKYGTEKHPISITVTSEAQYIEIEAKLKDHGIFANITLDANGEKNLSELEVVLNKPTTITLEKTPNRNDPCSCGSGKKYKKCCA